MAAVTNANFYSFCYPTSHICCLLYLPTADIKVQLASFDTGFYYNENTAGSKTLHVKKEPSTCTTHIAPTSSNTHVFMTDRTATATI